MIKRGTQQVLALNPSVPRPPARLCSSPDSDIERRLADLLYPAIPTAVFKTYWRFAVERQNVFFCRFEGQCPPWTNDPILTEYRFTNAYRAADRVSQYLIRNVQSNRDWSHEDLLFRTILFKTFNRITTWEKLLGEDGEPRANSFSPERYGRILEAAIRRGERIYSAAYIMPSGGSRAPHRRKHTMHLHLLQRMLEENLADKLSKAKTMAEGFALLRAYPTIGDFLAYQYVTDLNYSALTNFDEMEFVKAGPGAHEGISKCFRDFGGKDAEWIIRQVTIVQEKAFSILELDFKTLWGRRLQLIDCQNLFCEVAKYTRVSHPEFNALSGRTRIKQKFVALPAPIPYTFPPKWGLRIPTSTKLP